MNNVKIYTLVFILLGQIQICQSSVFNQTKTGIPLHWGSGHTTVDLYVNSQNTQSLAEESVQSIAGASIEAWNGHSKIILRKNSTEGKNQEDLNELYFSKDPDIFNGTGVIGITQVSFKDNDGEILGGDVLINDNYSFSMRETDQSYLGNVITHEIGHFLGLGHGQVLSSAMFYAITRGQYIPKDDDKSGLYSLYPNGDVAKGTLTGTIIGGRKQIGVFGTHVQAISIKTGKVMGATISEASGKFKISGLPINDQFIIYTSPVKQMGIPSNYAGAKSDYCESSKKYRGSFFQSCGSRSEGFPEAVSLNSSTVDIGKITIRCSVDSPPEYFQDKGITPSEFDVFSYANLGLGGSFVGSFLSSELKDGSRNDYFRMNLSNVSNWDSISNSNALYLELKILNQAFYSPFKANVTVKRLSGTSDALPKYTQEEDGWLSLESIVHIPINRSNSSDNDFEVVINAEDMQRSIPSGIPSSLEDYFPSFSEFKDDLYFYLVMATIVKKNDDQSFTHVASRIDNLSDNSLCPDAINTYALTNYSVQKTSSSSSTMTDSERKKVAGCGSVEINGGGASGGGASGGGPMSLMVGLLMSFILYYGLSRYSKLT